MDEELMVILSKENRAFETAWFSNMKAAKKWADKIRDTSNYVVTIFKGCDDPNFFIRKCIRFYFLNKQIQIHIHAVALKESNNGIQLIN